MKHVKLFEDWNLRSQLITGESFFDSIESIRKQLKKEKRKISKLHIGKVGEIRNFEFVIDDEIHVSGKFPNKEYTIELINGDKEIKFSADNTDELKDEFEKSLRSMKYSKFGL